MKFEQIPRAMRENYTEICPCCGYYNTILTCDAKEAIHEAEVYMQCHCGEWLEFILPVN